MAELKKCRAGGIEIPSHAPLGLLARVASLLVAGALLFAMTARAQLAITEMLSAAYKTNGVIVSTNNSDFWELTNFGPTPVDLAGYQFSDKSHPPGYLPPMSIGAGESVLFVRNNSTTNEAQFREWWGSCVGSNVQIGFFANPGFSSYGDGIRVYDPAGQLVDSVNFGLATRGVSFVYDTNTGVFGTKSVLGQGGTCRAETAADIASPGVTTGPIELRIVQQPTNFVVCGELNATFKIEAVGLPRPRYQWLFNGTVIPGAIKASLTVTNVSAAHEGVYSVIVTNGLTNLLSSNALLTIPTTLAVPSVVALPVDVTVVTNRTARFSISVCAFPAATYQWFSNDVALAGATNRTLFVPECTLEMSGTEYAVQAANPIGSVSASARLYVTTTPILRLTEVMAAPVTGCDEHHDWFEVTNLGANAVDLLGYRFSDQFTLVGAEKVKQSVVVQPQESVVFVKNPVADIFIEWWGANQLPPGVKIYPYGGFSLGKDGDALYLWSDTAEDPDEFLDSMSFSAAVVGQSIRFDMGACYFGCDSVLGEFGAFRAAECGDIGSPGYTSQPLSFTWSNIPSPQFTNAPFTVTIQARDSSNQIDTSFTGTVALRDAAAGGVASNSILPSPSHDLFGGPGNLTIGYSFTPGANLTVRAVRHYYGTKVSIWTETGVLLVAQPVTSLPGAWVETSLTVPLQLNAGTRYRVASHTGGGNFYARNDLAPTFPNGTIDQGYSAFGDAFPTNSDFTRWSFVDLRYTAPAVPVPITPAISGLFTNGIWSGVIRSTSPATNLVLLADDGAGHRASSNPFHVVRSNQSPVIVSPPASQTVNAGRKASFSPDVYGTPPFTYQWRRNGTNLSNGGRISGATASVLTLSNVTASDAAFYSVSVGNAFGSNLSSSAALTINPADHFSWSLIPSPASTLTPFAVSVQARDFLENVATSFTGTVAVSASLAGSGTSVPVSPTVSGAFVAGVWNGMLSVPQVAANAVLRAEDSLGDSGFSAPFNVEQLAAFTLQPTNQDVLPGTNVTLVANAVGTGPVRYQWRFEGANILDATNASHSFTDANLTDHHGDFSVVVTDDLSTAISSNAFIYVLVKPGIVEHLVSQSVLQGRSLTFTLIATGAPPLWYRWIKGGTAYATTSVPVLLITNIQASTVLRVGVTNRAQPTGTFSPGPTPASNVSITMLPDADGDGLPDAWELAYFSNTTNATATADSDGDGLSNRDEFIAGTNPTNALSLLNVVFTATNANVVQFVAQTNVGYTVQYGTNLAVLPTWNKLTNIAPVNLMRTIQVNTVTAPGGAERYIRVVTPLVP